MPLGISRTMASVVTAVAPSVIALDQRTSYNGSAAGDPHTFNVTIAGANRLALLKITWQTTASLTAARVGGSGGSLMTLRETLTGASDMNVRLLFLIAPPTGLQQVWIDFSGSVPIGAEMVTLAGVHQTTPFADSDVGTASSTDSVSTPSLTNNGSGNWLETAVGHTSGSSILSPSSSPGTPTKHANLNVGDHAFATSSQSGLAGAVVPTWSSATGGVKAMAAGLLRPA